ncbi:MAG: hypothetical protein U1E25_07345 [Methylocystis sp.]
MKKRSRDFAILYNIDGQRLLEKGPRSPEDDDALGVIAHAIKMIDEIIKRDSIIEKERKLLWRSRRALHSTRLVVDGLNWRDRIIIARGLFAMATTARYYNPLDDYAVRMTKRFVKNFRAQQAAVGRRARSQKPEELALMAAIGKSRGNGHVAKPTKEASAILDQVNKDLVDAGFKPVKVDVVRRRLEKFPRS